jgi:catechol 2,3-dioxygenase-like lactoylglutathione lyase family enzyme
MIQVQGLKYIGTVVRNLEACKEFYGTLLGLKTIPRPPFDFPGHTP